MLTRGLHALYPSDMLVVREERRRGRGEGWGGEREREVRGKIGKERKWKEGGKRRSRAAMR